MMGGEETWEVRFAFQYPEARSVGHVREELALLPWWERLMVHAWVALL